MSAPASAIASRTPTAAASTPHSAVIAATVRLLVTVHAASTRATRSSGVRLSRSVANTGLNTPMQTSSPNCRPMTRASPPAPGITKASPTGQQARRVPAPRSTRPAP